MWARVMTFFSRLGCAWARRRLDEDAQHEIDTHLEMLTDRYVRQGMTRDEGRAMARRQFGNATTAREEVYDMNSVAWIEGLVQDLRYASRQLRRSPSFAAVVTVTLALGIGANVAILSVVYAVLVRPLPYSYPEQIYSVEVIVPERQDQNPSLPVTLQAFLRWRDAETTFSDFSTLRPWECNLVGDGEPERLGGARVSSNFFSFFGVDVALGRGFAAEEERPGQEHVVVISDALWKGRYGADPTIIGRRIRINDESHVVVGVASPSALMPTGTQLHPLLPFAPRIDIWKPIAPSERELNSESWDHGVLVRLPRDTQREQGQLQLAAIVNEIIRVQAPGVKTEVTVRLVPIREIFAGNVRLRLLLVVAASTLLLLTACASTSNVFLARIANRGHEFATRIALGARRRRIATQVLTEAILLAGGSGVVAAVLAHLSVQALAALGPDDVRLLVAGGSNLSLLLLTMAVTMVTGIACGLLPAWQASRKGTTASLREGTRTSPGSRHAERSRRALVGLEAAFATVLLASAGLLLHSFVNLTQADRGYETDRVLAVDLSLFGQRYDAGEHRVAFYGELVDKVRALPGVVGAGAINNLPAVSAGDGASRTIFHATDTDFQSLVLARPVAMIRSATTGYFAASGSSLQAGRLFDDGEPAPVAILSASLARRLWPRETPAAIVGRQVRQGNVSGPLITVTGVVADAQPGAMDREAPPAIYRPYAQWASGPMTLVVRTAQEPSALAPAIRSEIRSLDPNLPIATIRTMREVVSSTIASQRFQTTLTVAFAMVALLLGAAGLYGVVSYSVASRTREIGLRIALGATRRDVMGWVFSIGMPPVLVGLVAGLGGAVAAATALRGLLFDITPADPLSLGIVTAVLLVTSCLACYLPARRAAATDPMSALRSEG